MLQLTMSTDGKCTLFQILLSVRNAVQTNSYEQDVKILGREADKRITFHGSFLDEDMIKCWWNQIANVASYGLLTRNCSTVVFKALHTGGASRFLDDPQYIIWTPNRLYRYCELLQWNTYRLRIYTNKNNEKVRTDFEYIFHELRNNAEIERRRKQQFDKNGQDMAKREDDIEKDSKKRKTEDEQSNDEDDKDERENKYIDELKSDESETDEKQRPNGEHYSVGLEGGEVSMDGQGELVKKMPRKRNRKRREQTTKYSFNIMHLRVRKDRTFRINNAILNNITVIAFQCRCFL